MSAPVSVASSVPWPSRIGPRAGRPPRRTGRRSCPGRSPGSPAEQTCPEWVNAAVSALSTAVSKSASSNTMFGLLPPISRATFLKLTAAPRQQRPARLVAAGQRDEVDVRAVGERLADASARPEDEVDDAGRDAGLLEQAGQVDRRQRRDLGRLHDRRVPGGERRRDLPADLEERVVPRPDQPADADRLVDDPADGVRVAGVDEAAARPCRRGRRSSGRRGRRRPCPSGSRASPCRC